MSSNFMILSLLGISLLGFIAINVYIYFNLGINNEKQFCFEEHEQI